MKYTLQEFRNLANQIRKLKANTPILIGKEEYKFSEEDLKKLQELVGAIGCKS